MTNEIIQDDILQIEELARKVLGTDRYAGISRMGGLTNHSYKITLENGKEYVVRIPGLGTEDLINRSDEKISTQLACDLGIDAQILYFGENGAKVTQYISGAVTMSADVLKDPKHIEMMANIFKKLHGCDVDTGVPFEVFDMAEGYEKIICDKQVSMFDDYKQIKNEVMRIKTEIDAAVDICKSPCHNDPLCENWVEDGDGRLYLIDWEYAGMNDAMWDLGDVSIEAGFDDACDDLLLRAYLGKVPDDLDRKHLLASKIYVDYLWTLWAKARVPYDGLPMEEWAVERYIRLKSFIDVYK